MLWQSEWLHFMGTIMQLVKKAIFSSHIDG